MFESYLLERDPELDSFRKMPNSVHAEQSFLGSLLIDNRSWDLITDKLVEADFYVRSHQLLFRAITALATQQDPFDVITLSEFLMTSGELDAVGGMSYLIMLSKDTPTAANIQIYAKIVLEKSVLRQLIRVGTTIVNSVYETDGRSSDELLESAEQLVFKIAEKTHKSDDGGFVGIRALAKKTVEKIEALAEKKGSLTGATTGFYELDKLTSGLQSSDLIILAGRPSMGKCFGKGTKILMYSGEVKDVTDIQVGDFLMGDDSTPRHVLSLARGRETLYWIRQKNANDYRVNESHILSLKCSANEGKHQKGDVLNLPLLTYLNTSDKFKICYKGYKVAVDFVEKQLPFSPYFLGLWLGNGSNEIDAPVLDDFHSIGNKQIPDTFIINSRTNRLELLAGLIDSDDGNYDKVSGYYEITPNNLALAIQIKFLCDSLGYQTSLIEKPMTIATAHDETMIYSVYFCGNVDDIPVKIEHKKANSWTNNELWNQTDICVQIDDEDEYFGFEIDGNKLFLLEDMTVVHNTTVAINIVENFSIATKKSVAVFSMEMPGDSIVMRMMSSLGSIEQQIVRSGELRDEDWPSLTSALTMLNNTQIFIDDSAALSPSEIRSRARRLARENGQLGLIVVDYLQLMQSPSSGENRVQQISDISRGLKALAKELNVPVIALSQLNRNLEQRQNRRPVMSDLRDSGAIEQDADLILFIYRDEVYNEQSPDKGTAELIIGKHRNGPLGMVRLIFEGHYSRFKNCVNPERYSSGNDQ
jgi:replicative DNA helicase